MPAKRGRRENRSVWYAPCSSSARFYQKEPIMRKAIMSALLTVSLAGTPFIVGCDREVGHSEKTTTSSDGTQSHSEKTTVQHPDGSTSTSTERHTTNTNP
jgi:hypothetical protein